MITIVDYGMGNLRSVEKAFQHLGAEVSIRSNPEVIAHSDALVLPGVGAFGAAVRALRLFDLTEVITNHILAGKPFLGICLGYQLLFESSEESVGERGLAVFSGRVIGFKSHLGFALPVPHIGWNTLQWSPTCPFRHEVESQPSVYFVHSYYPEPTDNRLIAAMTEYGVTFASAIAHENLLAVQFHPEKSGTTGLKILANFMEVCG